MAMPTTSLMLYLRSCSLVWLGFYLMCSFLCGLPCIALHAVGIGFLLCLVSYFRLPPPDPASTLVLLGPDPRSLDGDPHLDQIPTQRKFKAGSPASANLAVRAATSGGRSEDEPPTTTHPEKDALGCIAHRAAGMDAPENTLAALKLCKRNGARAVEFDVSFTSDGVAVVFHDDSTVRTTGQVGLISHMTFDEVQKLDAAATHIFRDSFSPERVPTVEEFVDECTRLDLRMIIDLKTWRSPKETADFVCRLYRGRPHLYSRALVSTFFPHLAYLIRQRDPKIVAAMAWRPKFLTYENWNGMKGDKPRFDALFYHTLAVVGDVVLRWSLHEWLWYFVGLSAVLIHKDVLTKEYLHAWRLRGVRVIGWTVNNSLQQAYLSEFLRVTSLSDTMDRIPLSDLMKETAAASAALSDEDEDKMGMDEGAKLFPDEYGNEKE